MKTFAKFYLAGLLILFAHSSRAQSDNWTHFRGNNLDGISADQNPPVKWSETENILWKTAIPGRGWSSPVVLNNQAWVTTATDDGRRMSGLCLDLVSGKMIYNLGLFAPDSVYGKHSINSYATPTPCIEDGFVYLHFGTYGTACVDTRNGGVVWKRTDLHCDHVQGPGSSPILYKDLLILHLEGTDVQYLVALNKKTGETVWKTERPAKLYEPLLPIGRKAYITPLIVHVGGRDLLISNGSAMCAAYDPETGQEVWRIVQGEDSTIAMPFAENGVVYFFTSFVTDPSGDKYAELLAVNPDGAGDIGATNILWRMKMPILQLLTPVVKNGLIYSVDTKNMLCCIDAKTGQEVYSVKLKQKYNSSPVCVGDCVYFTSVRGETMVVKEGREFQLVAENKLLGEVYATPALVGNSIVFRTDAALYRIGTPARP